jgi:hypothetical protein
LRPFLSLFAFVNKTFVSRQVSEKWACIEMVENYVIL